MAPATTIRSLRLAAIFVASCTARSIAFRHDRVPTGAVEEAITRRVIDAIRLLDGQGHELSVDAAIHYALR